MNNCGEISVLLVDDDPDFGELARLALQRADETPDVRTATDASEGLDELAAEPVDCIVSDYDMPGQDGLAFLKPVREEHPCQGGSVLELLACRRNVVSFERHQPEHASTVSGLGLDARVLEQFEAAASDPFRLVEPLQLTGEDAERAGVVQDGRLRPGRFGALVGLGRGDVAPPAPPDGLEDVRAAGLPDPWRTRSTCRSE